ncbi:chemotaxis protein [Vibrio sp. 10N.286.49.B3]|uniref:chemotaxis protein n=1 Tax=Vibrio sp. 10N.286.49.B3 TaxID=1880855 RepID=UPI000C8627DE|nr:chemotaxis protein [Vibrio sp. 10N.286.49.B3]PMH40607.1 chemotaxis protein [Vibrio sp. 10N.286.49.B3]
MRICCALLLGLCITVLSGCSLLEVKIDSQTTPLTQQELNTRLMTREYAQRFFTQIEQTADDISSQYATNDQSNQSLVLLWKINAEEGLQNAAYQASPMAALIDTWVFTRQMVDYFSQGKGEHLFLDVNVPHHSFAQSVSAQLLMDIDQLASALLSKSVYLETQHFVQQFTQEHIFTDITFHRTPAYRAWLKYRNINEADVASSLGTMPEAMGDVSDRLSLVSEQTPKLMTWKAQLIALNSTVSGEDLTRTMQSFRDSSEFFQDFVENNPQYMQVLAQNMAIELQPLLNDLDIKTDDKIAKLTIEREALEVMVARERQALINMVEKERLAIADIVTQQRTELVNDLDQASQNMIALAVDKLIQLIKSTIIYFILFILVIFFAPLGLGYALGKRAKKGQEL